MTLYLTVAVMIFGLLLFLFATPGPYRPKIGQAGLWTYVAALLVVLATFSGVVEIAVHATHR